MATITLTNADVATLSMPFRHGKAPTMDELANLTFTTAYFPDGTQIKDITFAQLADAVWTLSNSHSASLTLPTKS